MILPQEGNNRRAKTLIAYQPTTPRAPKVTMETTQNRTERFEFAFSYITTTHVQSGYVGMHPARSALQKA